MAYLRKSFKKRAKKQKKRRFWWTGRNNPKDEQVGPITGDGVCLLVEAHVS
jgi:hypothetical protein